MLLLESHIYINLFTVLSLEEIVLYRTRNSVSQLSFDCWSGIVDCLGYFHRIDY